MASDTHHGGVAVGGHVMMMMMMIADVLIVVVVVADGRSAALFAEEVQIVLGTTSTTNSELDNDDVPVMPDGELLIERPSGRWCTWELGALCLGGVPPTTTK